MDSYSTNNKGIKKMNKVTRFQPKTVKPFLTIKKKVKKNSIDKLPDEIEIKKVDFKKVSWLIYGAAHIGKTSLVAQFPESYFVSFDKVNSSYPYQATQITSYNDVLRCVDLLEDNPDYCNYVVFDNIRAYYQMAIMHTCKEMKINDIASDSRGAGWRKLELNFVSPILRIAKLNFTIIGIAHSQLGKVSNAEGKTENVIMPDVTTQPARYFKNQLDVIGYYRIINGQRTLTIEGNSHLEANHKVHGRFLYSDKTRIQNISMGKSEQEGFSNIMKGFNNSLPKIKTTYTKR
jgi:AAA domain